MKQVFQFLITGTFALCFSTENTVYAQPTGMRSRLIAKTLECFASGTMEQCEDSLIIRWYDTAGADFDYRNWQEYSAYGQNGYNAYYGYYFSTYIGYDTISPRAYAEWSIGLFDSLIYYTPAGAGFLPDPGTVQTQLVNGAHLSEGIKNREGTHITQQQEYFYNASGDRIATKKYGDVPVLTLKSIDSFRYDNHGNLLSIKTFGLNTGTTIFESIEEHTYNSNNRVLQTVYSNAGSGGTISPARKITHTYNTTGQRTSTIEQDADASGVLKNTIRYDFSYNNNAQTLSRAWEHWNGTAWDTTGLIRYAYGTSDVPEVAYIQMGGSADTSVKFQYFLNSKNQPDSIIRYSYAGPGQWQPQQRRTLLYNEFDQNTLLDQKSNWDPATQTWSYYFSMDFRQRLYYETFNANPTDVKNATTPLTFSVYPNPVQDVLQIRSGSEPIRLLSVYDLTGRLLIRQQPGKGNREVTLRLGSLPAGMYTLKVDGEQSYGSKKIIVH